MPWVIDQWAKSECEIELSGVFIQSVDLDGPDADLGRDIQRATQGIHQQQRPKTLLLDALIDCEPTKQHHWDIDSRKCPGLDVGKCLVDHSMR